MFLHPSTVYTGVHFHSTGALVQRDIVDVVRGSPAYRAGLRTGDVVACLSERDYNLLFQEDLYRTAPGYVAGTPIRLCVQRGSLSRSLQFVGQVRPPGPSLYHGDAFAALRLAAYAVFLLSAIALVLGRPGALTWIFFAYCLFSAPSTAMSANLATLPPPIFALIINTTSVANAVAFGLLLLFTVLVPDDRPPPGWRVAAHRAAWGSIPALAALNAAVYGQTTWSISITIFNWSVGALTAATVLVVFARLLAMQHEERARFGWAAFAIVWGAAIDFLRSASLLPITIGAFVAVFTVVTPIALMYAILKRHVIDVRFVISRTVVYAVITTLVVGIIGAVDWATSAYLHEARIAMALDALVTIGIAFALNRVHHWLEYAVDFVLFRKKYEAETYLKRLARTLSNANHEQTVNRALVRDPYQRLELSTAALFRALDSRFVLCSAAPDEAHADRHFEPDHDVVRFLTTERARVNLHDLDRASAATVAIPIFQGNVLTGFALYGTHRDGTSLDPDEIETLERLCDAAAQAYTLIENANYRSMLQPTPA